MSTTLPPWATRMGTTSLSPGAKRFGLPVLAPVLFLVTWEAIARAELVSPVLLPPISEIFGALVELFVSGEVAKHVFPSLYRMLVGFAIGAILGVATGVALGLFPVIRTMFGGMFELLRPIPPIALIPLALLWFGIGSASKIVLIAFATFWPIALNTELGVREIPALLTRASRVMEITGGRYYWKVVMPAAMPKILTGLRIGSAIALIVVVAAEMVASPNGIGFMIISAERSFRTAEMYAGIILISLLGYTINSVLMRIERAISNRAGHVS